MFTVTVAHDGTQYVGAASSTDLNNRAPGPAAKAQQPGAAAHYAVLALIAEDRKMRDGIAARDNAAAPGHAPNR